MQVHLVIKNKDGGLGNDDLDDLFKDDVVDKTAQWCSVVIVQDDDR